MTVIDDNGNAFIIESSDTEAVIHFLNLQTAELKNLVSCQADTIATLETMTENQSVIISNLEAENTVLTEMNTYAAYTFAVVTAFLVYKIVSSALSAIFGGG